MSVLFFYVFLFLTSMSAYSMEAPPAQTTKVAVVSLTTPPSQLAKGLIGHFIEGVHESATRRTLTEKGKNPDAEETTVPEHPSTENSKPAEEKLHIEEKYLPRPIDIIISVPSSKTMWPIRNKHHTTLSTIELHFSDVAEVVRQILDQNPEEREQFLKRIATEEYNTRLINAYRKSKEVSDHIDSLISPYQEALQKAKRQRIWCALGGAAATASFFGTLWLYKNNCLNLECLKTSFSYLASLRK